MEKLEFRTKNFQEMLEIFIIICSYIKILVKVRQEKGARA